MSEKRYADKKVLISMTSGPNTPKRAAAPFMFAHLAARQGATVSLCFVVEGPRLLKQGVAENLIAAEGGRPLRAWIDVALKAGVQFFVCDAALQLCAMKPEDLIEEVDNLVGPAFLITTGLESDLVLSF
jgi:predicted peroxiredoxin